VNDDPEAPLHPRAFATVIRQGKTGGLSNQFAAAIAPSRFAALTPADIAGCIGSARERFERELRRGRYVGKLVVVIEGTLSDVCVASHGLSHNSITGTLAAWTLRYCPFVFCGSQRAAADFAFRFLAAQVRDIERMAKAIAALPQLCQRPKSDPGKHL
jgi:hypothetical protein